MYAGILETDDTYIWQPRLGKCIDYRLRLEASGLKYISSKETLANIEEQLKTFPAKIVFMGSGAFHHLSLLLIARSTTKRPLSVLIFDQHADFFSVPEGFVSCGSWIRELIKLPAVSRVIICGVIGRIPNPPKKVVVLTPQSWRFLFKRKKSDLEELLGTGNIYLTIDKDVFAETNTDWGRGELSVEEVLAFLQWCLSRRLLVGADVCGEAVPRGLWPTLEEQRLIAENEKINLALCRLLIQQNSLQPRGHSRSHLRHSQLRPTA